MSTILRRLRGGNLEVFKFGMYIMFPIGVMYYFGTNLDSRFSVPDFWPKEGQTHTIPFEKEDIQEELERLKQRRLQNRAKRLALQSEGVNTEHTEHRVEEARNPRPDILETVKVEEPEKAAMTRESVFTASLWPRCFANYLTRLAISQRTKAFFHADRQTRVKIVNCFSARYGFVVAEYNVSPAEQIKRNEAKGMDWEWHAPWLSKWSDVLYVVMRWQTGFGETRFGSYRWCFRAMVKNRETKAVVKQALGGRLQNVRPWPGKSFRVSRDSEVGKALLGSPNGSGVGFMFADRKTDLGKKVVSEIIIFDGVSGEGRKDEDIKPCMAMKIVDKPSGSDGGVAGGGGNANIGAGLNSNPKGKRSFWQNLKGLLRGVGRSKL
ncbi:hypothetical protein D0866_11252 [Hortaea werneckii]|uniref:Uncharacterized protein n=1 Tax=Hortaea werneckii TaxID=91943 RepID=A0A3M7ACD5_HORWE|nr:hypothetical protein D0866_11252 [Hortaea werneckii]